jgi:Spy/CpxP family protein refolding chaperone
MDHINIHLILTQFKEDTMRKSAILILGLASLLVTSPMAWADEAARCAGGKVHMMAHHGGHRHGSVTTHLLRHLLKNKQELGLTDEQITKLRMVALDADRARIRAKADVKVSERELRAMLWDEKAPLPTIEAKIKEKEVFDANVRIIGIRAGRELIGVLTPEQQAKQKSLWEQYRHQDRRHMMRAEAGESLNGANGIEAGMDVSGAETSELEDVPTAG